MNDTRKLDIHIRVSESERKALHKKAADKGLTLSAYLRFLALTDRTA